MIGFNEKNVIHNMYQNIMKKLSQYEFKQKFNSLNANQKKIYAMNYLNRLVEMEDVDEDVKYKFKQAIALLDDRVITQYASVTDADTLANNLAFFYSFL